MFGKNEECVMYIDKSLAWIRLKGILKNRLALSYLIDKPKKDKHVNRENVIKYVFYF